MLQKVIHRKNLVYGLVSIVFMNLQGLQKVDCLYFIMKPRNFAGQTNEALILKKR